MPLEPEVREAVPVESEQVHRSAGQNAIKLRYAACQLQLCKSRGEPPHAALKETAVKVTGSGFTGAGMAYACATCGTTLVRSSDPAKAGWSQRRVPPEAGANRSGGAGR